MDIVVPELGESIVEATVLRWLKQQGEPVNAGEVVVELETEKVNLEVSAERAGVLTRIVHGQGEDVKIGDVLGVIEETTPAASPAGGSGRAPDKAQPVAKEGAPEKDERKNKPLEHEMAQVAPEPRQGREATPVAKRYAEQYGVDVNDVPTTATDGRITKQDVQAYIEHRGEGREVSVEGREARGEEREARSEDGKDNTGAQAQATAPSPQPPAPSRPLPATGQSLPAATAPLPANTERVHMSRRRQTIARRLVEAQHQAAMLTTFNEVDMTEVIALRTRFRDSFKQRYGVGLGFTAFFVKAAIGALKGFPRLNAEIQGDEMLLKHYYDIGIAVGAAEGLVVPVIREADRLSFVEIEKKIGEFAKKAEEGSLSLEDLRGGSFTITNGGVFGSLLSTPILNPPQVGILGLHKIEERPVARQGQVVIRPMMYVALSYDHRIVDGREAVQFLVRIKELIEDPSALLLEG